MRGSHLRNLTMFKKPCGENCFHSVILAVTRWEELPEETANLREKELMDTDEFWGVMMKRGSTLMGHKAGDKDSAMQIIGYVLESHRQIVLDIQHEMVNEGRKVEDTAAGRFLALLDEYTTVLEDRSASL